MKANELMIGDWVRVNRDHLCIKKDTIVEVRGIDANNKFGNHIGCAICRPLDDMQYEGGIWCDALSPIPLTAEILKKNGFIYNESPFVQGWERYGLTLTAGGDGCRVSCGQNISMTIDSVHELQHALRLCGIEKEIEL